VTDRQTDDNHDKGSLTLFTLIGLARKERVDEHEMKIYKPM